jgi:hypothetical protein
MALCALQYCRSIQPAQSVPAHNRSRERTKSRDKYSVPCDKDADANQDDRDHTACDDTLGANPAAANSALDSRDDRNPGYHAANRNYSRRSDIYKVAGIARSVHLDDTSGDIPCADGNDNRAACAPE